MSLIQEVKSRQLAYRKARDQDRASCLTTLIGEAEAVGKRERNGPPTDGEVISMAGKHLDNVRENIRLRLAAGRGGDLDSKELAEIEALSEFIPQQMTEEHVRATLSGLLLAASADGRTLTQGDLMKHMKAEYTGRYDGASAARIAKELLA